MIQKDKQLLLRDLCARLPYDVEAQVANNIVGESKPLIINKPLTFEDVNSFVGNDVVIDIKLYLRPMSSMTEEEKEDFGVPFTSEGLVTLSDTVECMDWLNSHHFDFRNLIDKGLAIEAPVDMYKTE